MEIIAAIKQGGADLVSVSEQIDDTPGGKLMHGIMASLAEYYSANLSTEAKKGMAQKAKNGGTHGVAPIGYLNSVKRIAGRDVKTVVIDEDRAHHVIWAYEAYTTGEWSISRLTAELESVHPDAVRTDWAVKLSMFPAVPTYAVSPAPGGDCSSTAMFVGYTPAVMYACPSHPGPLK